MYSISLDYAAAPHSLTVSMLVIAFPKHEKRASYKLAPHIFELATL